MEAFYELSTCRPGQGMGLSAIPFLAISEYAKLYGLQNEEFEEFLYLIRRMDSELIRLESKKQSEENGRRTKKGNPRKN